jgi:hypothetical protein
MSSSNLAGADVKGLPYCYPSDCYRYTARRTRREARRVAPRVARRVARRTAFVGSRPDGNARPDPADATSRRFLRSPSVQKTPNASRYPATPAVPVPYRGAHTARNRPASRETVGPAIRVREPRPTIPGGPRERPARRRPHRTTWFRPACEPRMTSTPILPADWPRKATGDLALEHSSGSFCLLLWGFWEGQQNR